MPTQLTAEVDTEKNELVIRVPLQAPALSGSGKTYIVASTRGFANTDATVNDKPVFVSVNAYIPKR